MLKHCECTILFNNNPSNVHISQILTGYKLLENQGILKIKSAAPFTEFRSSGHYEHNSIVEVKINGKKIVYDMADGYQSIHRKDVFDKQLDGVDFYFKRSYDKNFHLEMKNRDKVKPLSLNYHCTCKRNLYDKFVWNNFSIAEVKRFLEHSAGLGNKALDYTVFESNGVAYDEYKLLFFARVWDSSGLSVDGIKKHTLIFQLQRLKRSMISGSIPWI